MGVTLNRMTAFAVAALCLLLPAVAVQAQVKVRIASESWDRLLYLDSQNEPKGDIADFVARMNAVQTKFHFELAVFPRLRLDKIFIDKEADVYPLRTTAWTKPELKLLATRTILESGDMYVAKRTHRLGMRVFTDLKSRSIVGVRGYHYRIFNNNSDEAYIKKHFNAYLMPSNETVMKFVLADRADVGILPELIMAKYFKDPAMRAQLVVGDEFDSRVELSNLVRAGGPISVAEMDTIVDLLVKTGDVGKLRERLTIAPAKK